MLKCLTIHVVKLFYKKAKALFNRFLSVLSTPVIILFPTIIGIVIAIGSINIKYFFAQPRHGKLQHVCMPKEKVIK